MFYQDFLRLINLRKKAVTRIKLKQEKMNQEIHIRDIFVFSKEQFRSFGESQKSKNIYSERGDMRMDMRLIDHIEFLANIGNEYHKHYYCYKNEDDTYTTKPDCLNKITRLSLNEFSLYTKEQMDFDDFSEFVTSIVHIAKKQQENLHLLLSSIAVEAPDKKILNISLYVQCGRDAKIETFCKGRAAMNDFSFEGKDNLSPQAEDESKKSPFIGLGKGQSTISSNSVISIKTQGEAEYIQAIDVCLDHEYKHSKKLILKRSQVDDDTTLFPGQVDHLLTSNCININKYSQVSEEKVVQIDPMRTRLSAKHSQNDSMAPHDLEALKPSAYHEIQVLRDKNGFLIKNPPFGSDLELIAQEERKLGGFKSDLRDMLNQHNRRASDNNVQAILKSNAPGDAERYYQLSQEAAYKIDYLKSYLLKQCQPSFLEKLFKAQSFHLKKAAHEAIMKSYQEFKELNESTGDPNLIALKVDVLYSSLKDNLKTVCREYFPNSLFDRLMDKIDEVAMHAPVIHP